MLNEDEIRYKLNGLLSIINKPLCGKKCSVKELFASLTVSLQYLQLDLEALRREKEALTRYLKNGKG